jgi:hypothetical protein
MEISMSDNPSEFGKAVHAVFPHFKKHGASFQSLHLLINQCLRRTRLTHNSRAHVWKIWEYLAEQVELSTLAKFEEAMPNGRVPDLLLVRGDKVWIVEVKAMQTRTLRGLHPKRTEDIIDQTVGAARCLEIAYPHLEGKVCPYVLIFYSDKEWGEYEPEWVDLTP